MMPSHHTLMRTGKGARTMPFIRFVAVILGLAAVVFGVIVALQGTAVLRWPEGNLMVGDRGWAIRGAILTMVGGIVVWLARRT